MIEDKPLPEVVVDVGKRARAPRIKTCPECDGSGRLRVAGMVQACGHCHGCGVVPESAELHERHWKSGR